MKRDFHNKTEGLGGKRIANPRLATTLFSILSLSVSELIELADSLVREACNQDRNKGHINCFGET